MKFHGNPHPGLKRGQGWNPPRCGPWESGRSLEARPLFSPNINTYNSALFTLTFRFQWPAPSSYVNLCALKNYSPASVSTWFSLHDSLTWEFEKSCKPVILSWADSPSPLPGGHLGKFGVVKTGRKSPHHWVESRGASDVGGGGGGRGCLPCASDCPPAVSLPFIQLFHQPCYTDRSFYWVFSWEHPRGMELTTVWCNPPRTEYFIKYSIFPQVVAP